MKRTPICERKGSYETKFPSKSKAGRRSASLWLLQGLGATVPLSQDASLKKCYRACLLQGGQVDKWPHQGLTSPWGLVISRI